MKIKKPWKHAVLFSLLLCLLLTGCAPSDGQGEGKESELVTEPQTEPQTEPPPPPVTLRVGSFNIRHCELASPQTIGARVRQMDLDIVGMQEVDCFASRSGLVDQAAELSAASGLPYYHFVQTIKIDGDNGRNGQYGTLILSRYPILERLNKKLYNAGSEARKLGGITVDVEGTTLSFFNTHLVTQQFPTIHEKQVEEIANATKSKEFSILTGDFNIESLDQYAPFTHYEKLINDFNTPTFIPSGKAIDNIFYTPSMTLVEGGVLAEDGYSDHYMLWAEFTWERK